MIIAKILKPQGIRGEIKVELYVDEFSSFDTVTKVEIDNISYPVEKIRFDGTFAYIKLVGVDDRNNAETLRGKNIEVDKEHRPKSPKDRYFIADVIGCKLIDKDNNEYGIIADILQHGSADVYCIKCDKCKQYMFPAIKNVILSYDVGNKQVIIDYDELKKVAVYED